MSAAKRTTQTHSSSFCGSQKTCTSPSGTLTFIKIKCVSLHKFMNKHRSRRMNMLKSHQIEPKHAKQGSFGNTWRTTQTEYWEGLNKFAEKMEIMSLMVNHWLLYKEGGFFLAISKNTKHNWHPSFNTLQKKKKLCLPLQQNLLIQFEATDWSYRFLLW